MDEKKKALAIENKESAASSNDYFSYNPSTRQLIPSDNFKSN
jgi:hypothetical protein